jgi:mannose-1-phosphate guanylyltransferase
MKFIITAGGQGKKLWPFSTVKFPKQFQNIIGHESLFRRTIRELLEGYRAEDIFISTKKDYVSIANKQVPEVPLENYFYEPTIAKDRGPAEGLAFLNLSIKHPGEPFMIIQPDCIRTPLSKFLETINLAEKTVKQEKKYVNAGIKALSAVMGVDYLELGEQVQSNSSIEMYKGKSYIPRSLDLEETKKIIEGYHVVIHCNHSCCYPDLMLDAYKQFRPDWHKGLMEIRDSMTKNHGTSVDEKSIDEIYAKMERGATEEVTKNLISESVIILLPFKWIDIGTWLSYYEFFAKSGEVLSDGNVIKMDSSNTLVKMADDKKPVVVYGVENLAVIDTGEVILVMPLSETGKVGEIVKELEKGGHGELV